MPELLRFQREFIAAVEDERYDTVAISGPRSLGKTFIAAHVLARCMTPGDVLNQPGREYVLGAASLEQARLTFQFIREALEPTGEYRWIDSSTRLGATHVKSNTKLRAISSNAKTSFGLVGVPVVVVDEPGSLEVVGGQLLADSLFTAQGKVGSKLKLILAGTLAPVATKAGHWWWELVMAGTNKSTHVQHFHGETEGRDSWAVIKRANPLVMVDSGFRRKLLEERDAARVDTRLKARFLSYRLNIPSGDESTVLLSVPDYQKVTARAVPERVGRPIVGVDLGGGRAWSAAVALWSNGRVEAIAVAPGIPDLGEQERRDRVPQHTYQKLKDSGLLRVAEGLKVQPPAQVWAMVKEAWGKPQLLVCDRFRLAELEDATRRERARLEPRVSRWSEAAFDIRSLRQMALDGPLSVDVDSRALLGVSLSGSMVRNDDQGNTCLVKDGTNNQARDDVAAALVLAAGAMARKPKRTGIRSLGLA